MADDAVTIALLADHPALVREVGVLRWIEWGYDDPSPDRWIEVTAQEALASTVLVRELTG